MFRIKGLVLSLQQKERNQCFGPRILCLIRGVNYFSIITVCVHKVWSPQDCCATSYQPPRNGSTGSAVAVLCRACQMGSIDLFSSYFTAMYLPECSLVIYMLWVTGHYKRKSHFPSACFSHTLFQPSLQLSFRELFWDKRRKVCGVTRKSTCKDFYCISAVILGVSQRIKHGFWASKSLSFLWVQLLVGNRKCVHFLRGDSSVFRVNNVVHKLSREEEKEQRWWKTQTFGSVWFLQVLQTFCWLLSVFKSTRFHPHSLLSQAIVEITILQHCFLYFLTLSNCSCSFDSFIYLFCRTWVILRVFFTLAAKLCPRVDITDLFHFWNCLYFFHLKEQSLLLRQHLLWTKLSWVFLHPLKEKK